MGDELNLPTRCYCAYLHCDACNCSDHSDIGDDLHKKKFQSQKELKNQIRIFGEVYKLCLVSNKIAFVLESKS